MPKLTKRLVDSVRPTDNDQVLWDDDLAGFGLRIKPTGVKSFLIQYRNTQGVSRRFTLGKFGKLTPEQARTIATGHFGDISKGADPAAERGALTKGVTVAELCDEYLKANMGLIKPSTLAMDRSRIRCHVKPLLGSKRVASLTKRDIEQFQADIAKGKTARKTPKNRKGRGGLASGGATVASRTVGMLGTILQRAVDAGTIAANPARGVKRPKDKQRKPPFSFEAVEALGKAMREALADGENVTGLNAIRALLLTGCRREEILRLPKVGIDYRDHCVRFEDTKSGPQMRALGESALDHFRSITTKGKSPYAFPSDIATDANDPKHFVGLPDVWERVRVRAEIENVTIHGLRHWFANAAAALGYSEIIIAALLGHKLKGVTHRYATAPDPALVAAADRISKRLADALDGVAQGKVVHFRGGASA
jgi:integrase